MKDKNLQQQRADVEAAHELISAYSAAVGLSMEREARTTPMLALTGQKLWEASYKLYPDDDCAAFKSMLDEAQRQSELLAISFATPQNQIHLKWSARWADQGFPQITMGHKYCAALLATSVAPDLLPDVIPPWKAFLVVLPTDLLFVKNQRGEPVSLTKLLVQQVKTPFGKHWNFSAMTDSTLNFWRHGCPTSVLVETEIEGALDGLNFMLPISDQEGRVAALIGRLIINICLAMSNPENIRAPKTKSQPRSAGARRVGGAPEIRTFQLGKPITLDCRETIKDYVLNGPKRPHHGVAPSVQVLVRGHWKRQAHGTGRTERRLTWIEPYWRGPEDAPILARPHALKGDVKP